MFHSASNTQSDLDDENVPNIPTIVGHLHYNLPITLYSTGKLSYSPSMLYVCVAPGVENRKVLTGYPNSMEWFNERIWATINTTQAIAFHNQHKVLL